MLMRTREISMNRFLLFLYVVVSSLIGLFDQTSSNIDVSAHVGGLISGICLGVLFQKGDARRC